MSSHNAIARGAADFLCLAAAPTFAIMAMLTGLHGDGARDTLCSATQDASPLSGMVPMYLLMSVFHAAPWLKLGLKLGPKLALITRWCHRRRSGSRPLCRTLPGPR
jgi:hypothetical protein